MTRRRTMFEKYPERRRNLEKRLRDRFNGVPICGYCGKVIEDGDVTLDHIIPVSKGGTDKMSNMVLSCSKCNGRKGENIREPQYRKLKDLPHDRRPPKRPKPQQPLMPLGDAWPEYL